MTLPQEWPIRTRRCWSNLVRRWVVSSPGVLDELLDVHPRDLADRAVGLAGPPLVPVHHHEVLLQLAGVPAVGRELRGSRPAVEEQEERSADVLRALEHPLFGSPDAELLEQGDAPRRSGAGTRPDPRRAGGERETDSHRSGQERQESEPHHAPDD